MDRQTDQIANNNYRSLPLHLVFGRAGATQEAAAQDPAGGTVSTHTHTKRGRWGEKVENVNANTI